MTDPSTLPALPGIYLITHAATGDTYVGSSMNIRSRFRGHLKGVADGKHTKRLLSLCKIHGADLNCCVLEITGQEPRFPAEQKWIAAKRPTLNKAPVPRKPGRSAEVTEQVNVRLRKDLLRQVEDYVARQPVRVGVTSVISAALAEWLDKHNPAD